MKVRRPSRPLALQCEQALARGYQQMIAHMIVHGLSPLRFGYPHARERLHHIKLGIGTDAPRQRRVAMQSLAIGENADMLAQRAAIVEHVAAHLRLHGKQVRQSLTDRGPGRRQRPIGNDITQVAGEMDFGHVPPKSI